VRIKSKNIWLLQDGEALPMDDKPRLMRTGNLAQKLVDNGFSVTWWTSRFDHKLKKYRGSLDSVHKISEGYQIRMLDGPEYKKNLSFARIRHYCSLAKNFLKSAETLPTPNIILASYPSPELCYAGMLFAKKYNIHFIVDIRDPWPDIFAGYFPSIIRWFLSPVIYYYRKKARLIFRFADNIIAVSESMLNWGLLYSGREKRDSDKVFYIGYNKVPLERNIIVPDHFTEKNPFTCLFVSTCGKSYDGDLLVEAVKILESRGEKRVKFIVTGTGECLGKWTIKSRGLKTIKFTGWLSDEELQDYFLRAHVGLIIMRGGITSYWLGNKIFEYLSASLVLINNIPGESEAIVNKHRLGLNIPRNSPEALSDSITTLLNAPGRVRDYMENSRRVFSDMFERGRIHDAYVEYLIGCLNR
jgi:glycosyltransferase involved in cell wall biosynthesis